MIRVLLVDDHASSREPLGFMLHREPDLIVVGEAGSLAEARHLLETSAAEVEVAIVDLGLPDGSGEELFADLRAATPDAAALVLTYFSDRERLARAVEAGASGVLHKSASVADVIDAVRRLHAGEQILTFEEVLAALRLARHGNGPDGEENTREIEPLTERELDVLRALADGLSDKEIAARCHIGAATVRSHVTNILAKLGATSRLQAVVESVRRGIVAID